MFASPNTRIKTRIDLRSLRLNSRSNPSRVLWRTSSARRFNAVVPAPFPNRAEPKATEVAANLCVRFLEVFASCMPRIRRFSLTTWHRHLSRPPTVTAGQKRDHFNAGRSKPLTTSASSTRTKNYQLADSLTQHPLFNCDSRIGLAGGVPEGNNSCQ